MAYVDYLAPGTAPADDEFYLADDGPDVLYCEDPDCGYTVYADERRYDEDPCCSECGCPLQPEAPEAFTIAYRDPLSGTLRRASAEPSYRSRAIAERRLADGRELRFADHPEILLSYRVVSVRNIGLPVAR